MPLRLRSETWQKVATEMKMPVKAVESMAFRLGQHQLSVRAKASAGSVLLCFCGCDGFSGPPPISLCYICSHESKDHHELKAHNVTAAELQLEPLTERRAVAQQGDPLEFRQTPAP
jgi:hypothetical protein